VCVSGIVKVYGSVSIPAGSIVIPYQGASMDSYAGYVQPMANGASIAVATASIAAQRVVLGRALTNGSTNTAITIVLQPQLYDNQLMA
jgi:hypothetical protein